MAFSQIKLGAWSMRAVRIKLLSRLQSGYDFVFSQVMISLPVLVRYQSGYDFATTRTHCLQLRARCRNKQAIAHCVCVVAPTLSLQIAYVFARLFGGQDQFLFQWVQGLIRLFEFLNPLLHCNHPTAHSCLHCNPGHHPVHSALNRHHSSPSQAPCQCPIPLQAP